jgi:hypothetical protein
MPKSKPPRTDRTKRAPRDPSPERDKSWRPSDEGATDQADGTVDGEMELDTDRYEAPQKP